MTDLTDLSLRTGLPDALRVLADQYPQAGWSRHPNFNELTRFWLERHAMFRKLMELLVTGSQSYLDRANPRYAKEVSQYTGILLEQLHGHHTIEDEHYFPKFTGLDRRLDQAFELLDRDHHSLDHHMHDLAMHSNAVLQALTAGADAEIRAGKLLITQQSFTTFLQRHLADEEEIIVPLILEYGPEIG